MKSFICMLIFSIGIVSCNRPQDFLYVQPKKVLIPISGNGILFGTITDSVTAEALPGVQVSVHAGDETAPIQFTGETDYQGSYRISGLPAGSLATDFTLSGYVPLNGAVALISDSTSTELDESLTTVLNGGQIRFVTTWTGPMLGAVRDVDSYLQIPGDEGYPVGYANPNDGNGANLDHDDTQWYGPETITITDWRQGTYVYYLNNYNSRCDLNALGNSNVVTHVYQGNQLLRTISIPPGVGITYELFRIVNGQIVYTGVYNDSLPVYGPNSCGNAAQSAAEKRSSR